MTELPTETLYRTVSLERAGGKDDRRARLAFSSEAPVPRFFGLEILDHSPGSVDLDFLGSGRAPVLVDHNTADPVGVVEGVSIGSDKIGRATVRFGNSDRATEIWKDVKDGIRLNASVGYRINEIEPVGDDKNTIRVTNWTPHEISIVSVPADMTVGVGRSIEGKTMTKQNENNGAVDLKPPQSDATLERNRVEDILTLARMHNKRDLGESAIREGVTIEQFKGRLLESIGEAPAIQMLGDEHFKRDLVGQYSLVRAINAVIDGDWSKAGVEREANEEITRSMAKKPEGFFMPTDALFTRVSMTVGTDAQGGYLKPTEHRDDLFVEALSNHARVIELGATVLHDLIGDVSIPKQTGKSTVEHVAEDAAATESNLTFGQINLSPKTATANGSYSRKLLKQGLPSIEQLLQNDLRSQIGITIDEKAIEGGGTDEPTGILQTTGIGSFSLGTDGGAPTWDGIVGLVEDIEVANAPDDRLAYLTNANVKSKLSRTAKVASTDSKMILDDPWDKLYGHKLGISNTVPSDLTKGSGTALSALIFGNFREIFIGMWGGLDIIVDPYTNSTKGNVRISAFQDYDVALRHVESFTASQDVITT